MEKYRLILISLFFKLNARIKELLEDKHHLKVDVRIVYCKSEFQPNDLNWLNEHNLYVYQLLQKTSRKLLF